MSKETLFTLWKKVQTARFVDQKMAVMVRQNKGTCFFISTAGHELAGTIPGLLLQKGKDWAFPYYRDRAFALALGIPMEDIFAAFLARDIPHHSSGRMMPDHFSDKNFRIPCQSSVVGSQYLQATGRALGVKFDDKDEVVYVSGGEGSSSQGEFFEALNFASLKELPVIFYIQDNGFAISTPVSEQTTGGSIATVGKGFKNLSVYDVDGTNPLSLTNAWEEAIHKAREKKGPSLIVAKVPRLGAHTISDDPKKYKTQELIEEEKKRDPLLLLEQELLQKGYCTKEEIEQEKKKIQDEVEKASLLAEAVPFPKKESATTHIFKDFSVEESYKPISQENIVMMDGLNHALQEEMRRDKYVLVFGEDVARGKGGVFGITRQLTDLFGDNRCFNTPLAEATIVGIAIGLAFDDKYRPVVEIQFSDYAWTGMNQIINELSSLLYRSNGEWHAPIVIRMTSGGYIQGGPYHSQNIESIFCHMGGLKVAIPSNASDAKRLLKTAIRDPNPVIFLEHKALYRQQLFSAKPEPSEDDLLPFGKANILLEGKDLTVITYGITTVMSYEVANELAKEGYSIELIDLRTLVPLDMDTILTSIKKTGKVAIVHEAVKTLGFGAELAARISEEGFTYLDAPITRVTSKDSPVPYSQVLEDIVLPQKKDIYNALKKLLDY